MRFSDVEACATAIVERLSGCVRLALPLGLGKPVLLANALYRKARENPEIELTIYTALTLELPKPASELEARMLEPLLERLYDGVPALDYATDLRNGTLPPNVQVEEFYFRPGAYLGLPAAQQNYTSLNYTHAARTLLARDVNVVAQMVAPASGAAAGAVYSLSCNPDVVLDLLDAFRDAGRSPPLLVGEVNDALPFMPNDAEVPAARFDMLVESEDLRYPLFPVPNRAVSTIEYSIALRVAALVRDGGTLQIGIGSLADALAYAIAMRRTDNAAFRALIQALQVPAPELDDLPTGLYGASEMLAEGFLYLRDCGVLSRTVDDGIYLHAGFFLGSAQFYEKLRRLSDRDRSGISMTRISFINQLLGDEQNKRDVRRDARFVNSVMMMTLLGAAVSDALEDGRVVSGVGGQYNFVAIAHELENARSILALPATRFANGRLTSNMVWNYGHTTIPRHLRDLVVTEYGVADLRGATDQQVIERLLNITDSRFQPGLQAQAVAAGKLTKGYQIPEHYRNNSPHMVERALTDAGLGKNLPFYPLGTDLTEAEAALSVALGALADMRGNLPLLFREALVGLRSGADPRLHSALERLGLSEPKGMRDRFYRLLVAAALLRSVYQSGRPLLPLRANSEP